MCAPNSILSFRAYTSQTVLGHIPTQRNARHRSVLCKIHFLVTDVDRNKLTRFINNQCNNGLGLTSSAILALPSFYRRKPETIQSLIWSNYFIHDSLWMKSTTSILHTFCCPRKRKKSSKIDPFDSNQCSSSRIVRELFHLTSPTFPLNTSYFSLNALMAQLVRKRLMIKISHLMLTPFQLEVPNESMEVLLILALTLRLRSFLYWKLIALVLFNTAYLNLSYGGASWILVHKNCTEKRRVLLLHIRRSSYTTRNSTTTTYLLNNKHNNSDIIISHSDTLWNHRKGTEKTNNS